MAMVKHIVCYKLKDSGKDFKEEVAQRLLSMKGKVPAIKDIEVGRDFLGSERSYDIALVITFETRAELEAYKKDEYHCSYVKPFMHSSFLSSVSVDYEI